MVYDRGRGGREGYDGPSFGSSGSPRSRFASDTGSFTQKSGPVRPHAITDVPMTDTNPPSMKPLNDLMSERVLCYIQHDDFDKKSKKLRRDIKRCQTGEFASAADLLDAQSRAADAEKIRCSQRMTTIDDKLAHAASAWCSRLEATGQSKPFHGNSRHDLTPPPSETSSDINLSIDEKLAQFRDNLEVSMRNQLAEGLRKLQCEVKDAYESRTDRIQNHALQETQKLTQARDSLEASMRNQIAEESQKLQSEIKDAYESRTATIQNHAMQESQKLSQMRSNLETVIRKQSAEESQKLQSKTKDNYEMQISTLKQDLSQEKEISKNLQAELKSMADRLAAIETKVEDQAKISSRLEQGVKRDAFVDLESRLAKCEASQTAANESTKAANDDEADMNVDNGQPQKMDSVTAQSLYLELEAELEDKMTQFLLQSGERIVPDERVRRVVQPIISTVEANLQNSLKRIADGFGPLIDKEREMRASLGVQVKAAAQSASASAEAIEVLRAEITKVQTTSDANRQSDATTNAEQEARLKNLKASTKGEIEFIKAMLQQKLDALWLRSKNMQAWQDNFSTIKLFEAIAQHLNSSFIPEHVNALVDLRTRVANIESHLGDGGNKKRKFAEQGPLPFPPPAVRR